MSPIEFLNWFRLELHQANISFAITSGQACVYYGLQQTTKYSDWIIAPKDVDRLVSLLVRLDKQEGLSVSFRSICGSPLAADFMEQGWTNHIAIRQAGVEHHLDFFCKPPRVQKLERDFSNPGYASRMTVASMKKTDREKHWPFVYSLARQAWMEGDLSAILHVLDEDELKSTWNQVPNDFRDLLRRYRPLLNWIESMPTKLKRGLMMERYLWQRVNHNRYRRFQTAWKEFYGQWRKEPEFVWPPTVSFAQQFTLLSDAAYRYSLPAVVITDAVRKEVIQNASDEARWAKRKQSGQSCRVQNVNGS